MELFSELKNDNMQKITAAINKSIAKHTPITKHELNSFYLLSSAEEVLLTSMLQQQDHQYAPRLNASIPVIPTKLELQWLTDMLNDPRSSLFLPDELKQKLRTEAAVPSSWLQQYWQNNTINTESLPLNPQYSDIFRKCYTSLADKKYVYYESHDDYGRNYQGEAAPFKLEYDLCSNTFNFIMWNPEKSWTFKSNVATITKLEILDKNVPQEVFEQAENYVQHMQQSEQTIRLQINTKKNNALKRCILLFSTYEKTLHQLTDDIVQIDILHRDHFDKKEIVQYILSLGSAVTVLQPTELKEEIIAYLQEAYTRK